MNKQDRVGSQINLIKLPANTPVLINLDKETEWVREFLQEMNENATHKSPTELLNETFLTISGEYVKKNRQDMGEYLLFKGEIKASYVTECVRTLNPMSVDLEVPLKVCFVDESLATTELFNEMDETYVDNDVYELYFYNKRLVEFAEMIHEQIFLNYEQYPILDAECNIEGVETQK